jgi:hypothetical protein
VGMNKNGGGMFYLKQSLSQNLFSIIIRQLNQKPKNAMAGSYRKNAGYRSPKKDVIRKAVCNKTKRKTKNEVAGRRL